MTDFFCKRSTYSWCLWNYRDALQFYTIFHPQRGFAFCVHTLSDLVGCLEEAPSRQLTWRALREVQSKTKASVASWGSLMHPQCCQKVQDVASVKCEILKLQKCPLRIRKHLEIFIHQNVLISSSHAIYNLYTHFFRSVLLPICSNAHFMFLSLRRCESNTCSVLTIRLFISNSMILAFECQCSALEWVYDEVVSTLSHVFL